MPLHRFDDSPLPRPEAGSRPSSEDTEPGGRGEATAEPTALPAPTVAEPRSVALTPPEGVAPAGRHERGRGRWCCAQAIVPADRERAWQGAAGATGGRRHASGSKMRTNSPEVTRTRRPPWVARQLRTIKIADFPCVPRGWRPISSWCPPRALMERVRTSHPCRRSEDRLPTTRTPCSYPCSYPHLCPKTRNYALETSTVSAITRWHRKRRTSSSTTCLHALVPGRLIACVTRSLHTIGAR